MTGVIFHGSIQGLRGKIRNLIFRPLKNSPDLSGEADPPRGTGGVHYNYGAGTRHNQSH